MSTTRKRAAVLISQVIVAGRLSPSMTSNHVFEIEPAAPEPKFVAHHRGVAQWKREQSDRGLR